MPSPLALSLITLLLMGCASPPEQVSLVISNVTVIDPDSRQVLEGHSVYVDEGRIRAVEPHDAPTRFIAADTVNGTGRFLIPGLLDMHVHLDHLSRDKQIAENTLSLLLANGVTGVRDMMSDCWESSEEGALCGEELRAMAEQIAQGERGGSRLLSLSSALVGGLSRGDSLPAGAPSFVVLQTESDGRQMARYLENRGVDLVKVYNNVPRAAYFALVGEATELGLEVSGHLPLGVSVVEASNAGQRTIEHARDLPLSCSSYSAEYRSTMNRVVEEEEAAVAPTAEVRLHAILEGFDASVCQGVLETLVENETYLVPTHGTREMDFRAGEPEYRNDPRRRYVPQLIGEHWDQDLYSTSEATPELVALYEDFYELGLRTTGMAHAAGVRIMVGTDANDTMIVPGFSLHDELVRFSKAGINPMEILRAATTVPTEYLGLGADLGGISVGRLADLVLLADDPLIDIRNTQAIEAVILGGRVHDRASLDGMLRRVEMAASASPDH